MKFTLCAIGSWGDVGPFLSLGRALLARGSDVVLAAPPEFAGAAAGAGLDFRPVAPTCTPVVDAASATTGASLRAVPLLLRATRTLTEETLGELPSIADGSQMIVATGIAYAAPHVAEALRIPYRAVAVCPRWYPSAHHPPATERAPHRPKIANSAEWGTLLRHRGRDGAEAVVQGPSAASDGRGAGSAVFRVRAARGRSDATSGGAPGLDH